MMSFNQILLHTDGRSRDITRVKKIIGYTKGRSRDIYGALEWGETHNNFLNFIMRGAQCHPFYTCSRCAILFSCRGSLMQYQMGGSRMPA